MKQEKLNLTPEEQLQVAIDKAKKKFGKVYKTIIADEAIIWRKLKRSEYKEIMNLVVYDEEQQFDENGNPLLDEFGNIVVEVTENQDATYDLRQEEIARAVIIYPSDSIVEDMAAVADIISTECMIKSGFGKDPKTEEC